MKGMALLPELVACLQRYGYLYTVRRYRYSLLDTPIIIKGVGICDRTHIVQVQRKENLEAYVYRSGFDTVDAWWRKIKELNKGYVGPFYLYEITLEEDPYGETKTTQDN